MRTGVTQVSPKVKANICVVVGGENFFNVKVSGVEAKILSIKTDEQVYGGKYIVELDNSDNSLTNKAYEGKELKILLSYQGYARVYFHQTWIEKQELGSRDGKLTLIVHGLDNTARLSQYKGSVGGSVWNHPDQHLDKLNEKLLPSSNEPYPADLITAINNQYDKTPKDIIDSVISDTLGISLSSWDDDGFVDSIHPLVSAPNARSVVAQALRDTKCYLIPDGNTFEIVQPDAHAVVYNYNISNLFYSNIYAKTITIPNRIVYHGIKSDGTHISTGSSHGKDAASIAELGEIFEHNDYEIASIESSTTQAEVDDKADARIARLQLSSATGVIVAPMHCSQELLDKISITDDRYDTPITYTGYVFRILREYDRGVYRITLILGGAEGGYTPDGEDDVRIDPSPVISAISNSVYTLPRAIQGYQHDIHFVAVDRDTISIESGGDIKFYDGTTQAINYIVSSPNTTYDIPDANIYYIYFDLDDASPNILKVTSNYLSVMSMKTGVLCMIQRGSNSDINALVLPSYGKEPLITPDAIYMTGLLNYDLGSNMYLQKMLSTSIEAGNIRLSSSSFYYGTWYYEGGIEIDVDDGILINRGHGGTQILDFKHSSEHGYIYQSDGELSLAADYIHFLPGYHTEGADIRAHEFLPKEGSSTGYVGLSGNYFLYMYGHYIKYKSLSSFQDHDDIALIRAMKPDPANHSVIDTKTLPIELRNVTHTDVEWESLLVEKNKDLSRVKDNYKPEQMEKRKQKIEEQYQERLAELNKTEDGFVDMGGSIGLAIGAIRQLADKVDILEEKINALSN